MRHFNLLDEPWIPVQFPDGSRGEVGIRDALLRSASITTIEDASPLVVASLHRLLLAVLYRALGGPTDIDQARKLFREGLPLDKIEGYLDKWRDRFWLFDDRFPFYQVPGYEPKEEKGVKQWKPWTVLAMEHNGDNSKVLVDHMATVNAGEIRTPLAARWLVACQTFTPGGGNSDFKYTRGGPAANAVIAIPVGHTLEETLIFCLVPENREILAHDLPLWEREPESLTTLREGPERAPIGWIDLYTWRSRSIRLRYDGDGQGVSGLAFASGVGLVGDLIDPMMGYRIAEKHGRFAVQFRERGLWRDFDSMLPDEADLAPRVIAHASAVTRARMDRLPTAILILGQATNKAKIEYWRMERFAFPKTLGGDRAVRQEVKELLEDAEAASRQLWAACSTFARHLLGRGTRDPTGGDKAEFVRRMFVGQWYWSAMESAFHDLLRELTLEQDSEEIRARWLRVVQGTLRQAWEQQRRAVATGDAWTIRALVKAERPVIRKLLDLEDEIQRLTPQMEEA